MFRIAEIDVNKIALKFEEFMKCLGLDLKKESIRDTPQRVAKMYVNELFDGLYTEPPVVTSFENGEHYNEIITNSATIFSICEHHFVPIKCKVHIGYIPNKKLCGISKLIRMAEWVAHRPQLQERMTMEIADKIMECLKPQGVMVVIEGEHFCEIMRGVSKVDSTMITSVVKGCFLEKPEVKAEFLKLIKLKNE